MNIDTFAIAALATEFRNTIGRGRCQRVTQINSLTYGFEIFVHPIRHYLILSVEPQAPRLHLSEDRVRRGVGNDTPLMLVLRKYLRGARLLEIECPPYERLLYFHFQGPFGNTMLAAEMIGTRSNLMLVGEDGNILGTARLPKSSDGKGRQTIPGEQYEPPPPLRKRPPHELTAEALQEELDEASPQIGLVRLLPQIITGSSRLLAREIGYRAMGDTKAKVSDLTEPQQFLAAFRELFSRLYEERWEPHLAYDEEGDPTAFAPYPITHLEDVRPAESMSRALELYFEGRAEGYAAAKTPLKEALQEARNRLERRQEKMREEAANRADPETLKLKGEAILAYAHEVEAGQTTLIAVGLTEEPLEITLDPTLSAPENAQQYFSRYRKALRTAEEIPTQLKKVDVELQYIAQLEQDLQIAENRPEIDAIASAMDEARLFSMSGRGKRRRKKFKQRVRYMRLTAPQGAMVWVGKNAVQNANLTFGKASPDDLWLHARDVPGSHVIIPTAQGLPSEEDVFWAASVAAYYSKARNSTSVDVDVTLKKYVRPIKGSAPGLVTYRNESTLRVVPEPPDSDEDDDED